MQVLKQIALISFTLAITTGCMTAEKFSVKPVGDRFSTHEGQMLRSEKNRISSKSIAGGTHYDGKGVFMNPYVSKSKNGSPTSMGLMVINDTDFNTMAGAVNQLGSIKKATFIINGQDKLVVNIEPLAPIHADLPWYNSTGRYATRDKIEMGQMPLSKTQLSAIANARTIACKLEGSRKSVTYNEGDITETFIPNIKAFYLSHIN